MYICFVCTFLSFQPRNEPEKSMVCTYLQIQDLEGPFSYNTAMNLCEICQVEAWRVSGMARHFDGHVGGDVESTKAQRNERRSLPTRTCWPSVHHATAYCYAVQCFKKNCYAVAVAHGQSKLTAGYTPTWKLPIGRE